MRPLIFALFTALLAIVPASGKEIYHGTSSEIAVELSSLTRVETKARNAAVRVKTAEGYGSGTYVIIADKRAIITAAHVVLHEGKVSSKIIIHGRAGENVPGRVVYIDLDNDFAVIIVKQLSTREPIKIKKTSRSMRSLIGESITYTGFPNNHDLMTIRGSIAGSEDGFLLLQSYTWMGASGSGVFDNSGNFIGILTAVDVGMAYYPQVVESVVWVIPLSNIEMRSVESIVQRANL
jgi:V8-like Glu-specific endopeptidase